MGHEVETMFAEGESPWHKLGQVVDQAQRSQEAMRLAGLDWRVDKVRLDGEILGAEGPLADQLREYEGVQRDSDNRLLGVVPSSCELLQNAEAFEFFDSIVGSQEAIFHTAGSLYGGKKVWILVKLPHEIRLFNGRDVTGCYMLLTHSHNTDTEVTVAFTPIRVVCMNTLTMALWGSPPVLTIPKVKGLYRYLNRAATVLRMAHGGARNLEEVSEGMARTQLTSVEVGAYVEAVLRNAVAVPERESAKKKIAELVETGRGTEIPGVRGTLWGAYNALVEYADHHIAYTSQDERLENAWYRGQGRVLKTEAYVRAVERIRETSDWGTVTTQQGQHIQLGKTW